VEATKAVAAAQTDATLVEIFYKVTLDLAMVAIPMEALTTAAVATVIPAAVATATPATVVTATTAVTATAIITAAVVAVATRKEVVEIHVVAE
jgi:hypothetical protein